MDAQVIRHALDATLEELAVDQQQLVLDFARSLTARRGIAGSTLLPFAGTMSEVVAEEISLAIKEGCEKVDLNGW